MVKTFAVNESNDIYVGPDGNIVIATGLFAIEQACKTAVQAYLGEMIYSVNNGVPYFETVFSVGDPNLSQFEASLRRTILSVEGVTDITTLVITIEQSILSYQADIVTIYGAGSINGDVTV